MNFQSSSKRRRETEITVIPLIDLFMTVLVFFILTTTFSQDTVFYIDLPEAKDAQKAAGQEKLVQVSIGPSGELALNNEKADISGVRAYFQSLKERGKKDIPVAIRADQHVSHGKVVEIIDIAQSFGINNIGILTRNQ